MAIFGLWKLTLANAANALTISSYLESAGMPIQFQLLCWISTYGFFTYMDCVGIKQSASLQVGVTFLCIALIAFYIVTSLELFDPSNLMSPGVPRNTKGLSLWFEDGWYGLFKSLPFGILLFDG